MIVIRHDQLAEFSKAGYADFENEMLVHSKEFSPRLSQVLGDSQLRVAVRQAMNRAATYQFTLRGPIRLYVELMFLCGSDFATDPQYEAIGEILNDSSDQMLRSQRIHELSLDYVEQVSGKGNANVHRALEALQKFAGLPLSLPDNGWENRMLAELHNIFPQRAAYIGDPRLKKLIEQAKQLADSFALPTVRGKGLLVALMFSFGHGCTNDPLYPWIAAALQEKSVVDGFARERRLEKKSLTWLRHVIETNRAGAST